MLGVTETQLEREELAHIFRVGVTNAADRGLDMWANFGPAVQVKHLTLNEDLATTIVDQVESDHIVIVCLNADAKAISAFTRQIGWGRRVCGIVTESDLVGWYERCLRGKFKTVLGAKLLEHMGAGFRSEFPHNATIADFLRERGYSDIKPPEFWKTDTDRLAEKAQ